MNISASRRVARCLLNASLFLVSCAGQAQSTNPPASQTYFGGLTNGIRGEVEVIWNRGMKKPPQIAVFVSNTNTAEVVRQEEFGTNWTIGVLNRMVKNDWLYYMPTNEFCGPIALKDSGGRQVSLLHPNVSLPQAYPSSYSLTVEHGNYFNRYHFYSGPGVFPYPLMAITARSEITRFQLEDYFGIKEPGEYELTVWPKIYKRRAKNSDLCDRVDLPPVSVTIKWDGPPTK